MKPRTKRREQDESAHSDDMSARAEQLEPFIGPEPESQPAPNAVSPLVSPLTILEHVTRLCAEWAAADPIKTEKRQQLYGTWVQIWNSAGRGMFSINLNTGSVWRMGRRTSSKPIGNVAEMIGDQLVELLRRE